MARTYRIGTRTSALALKQVEEVLNDLRKYHPIDAKVIGIDTYGDKDKITPISEIEGTDFFTKELEQALLGNQIDFAVHSAKDLPEEIPEGLCVAAVTESIDPYDALVSKKDLKLTELPKGSRIGTSSSRRKERIKFYRKDFEIVDIRGNIEERLKLLDSNERRNLDAVIIAACGLMRLGLEHRITERIPFEILQPHPLQGSLAVETREEDLDLIELLSKIDARK